MSELLWIDFAVKALVVQHEKYRVRSPALPIEYQGAAGAAALTYPAPQRHAQVATEIETKFLRLFRSVGLGDYLDGRRVCWIGGWDKCRVLFVVMVERQRRTRRMLSGRGERLTPP
jgi:hypothetical protein